MKKIITIPIVFMLLLAPVFAELRSYRDPISKDIIVVDEPSWLDSLFGLQSVWPNADVKGCSVGAQYIYHGDFGQCDTYSCKSYNGAISQWVITSSGACPSSPPPQTIPDPTPSAPPTTPPPTTPPPTVNPDGKTYDGVFYPYCVAGSDNTNAAGVVQKACWCGSSHIYSKDSYCALSKTASGSGVIVESPEGACDPVTTYSKCFGTTIKVCDKTTKQYFKYEDCSLRTTEYNKCGERILFGQLAGLCSKTATTVSPTDLSATHCCQDTVFTWSKPTKRTGGCLMVEESVSASLCEDNECSIGQDSCSNANTLKYCDMESPTSARLVFKTLSCGTSAATNLPRECVNNKCQDKAAATTEEITYYCDDNVWKTSDEISTYCFLACEKVTTKNNIKGAGPCEDTPVVPPGCTNICKGGETQKAAPDCSCVAPPVARYCCGTPLPEEKKIVGYKWQAEKCTSDQKEDNIGTKCPNPLKNETPPKSISLTEKDWDLANDDTILASMCSKTSACSLEFIDVEKQKVTCEASQAIKTRNQQSFTRAGASWFCKESAYSYTVGDILKKTYWFVLADIPGVDLGGLCKGELDSIPAGTCRITDTAPGGTFDFCSIASKANFFSITGKPCTDGGIIIAAIVLLLFLLMSAGGGGKK